MAGNQYNRESRVGRSGNHLQPLGAGQREEEVSHQELQGWHSSREEARKRYLDPVLLLPTDILLAAQPDQLETGEEAQG